MNSSTPEQKQEAVLLINRLRSGKLNDDELSEVVLKLLSFLPDPYFMAYTIDHVPELSAEDVIQRAFEYQVIRL